MYKAEKLNILLFQHKIYDLELGYFEVLEKRDFCAELLQYLKRLFDLGHKDILINVLEKIGMSVTDTKKQTIRANALGVVTGFTDVLKGQKDKELFQIVAKIVTGWLQTEKGFNLEQKKILSQIGMFVKKMFSLQLWHQSQPLVSLSRRISRSASSADRLFKKEVSKLHRKIADKTVIQLLVQSFLESKAPSQAISGDLLLALAPHSSETMIHSLFKCSKKNTRLAFLEMIPQESEGVLPVLIKKLKDKQPWYVVRNSMVILGALGDPDLYHFARPFINHPDSRVQSEVVRCIASLGGENVVSRLINTFPPINDDVKSLVIEQLQPFNDSKISALFLDILGQRNIFASNIQEELICNICSSGKLVYSERTISILESVVNEREYNSLGINRGQEAARASLESMKNIDNIS